MNNSVPAEKTYYPAITKKPTKKPTLSIDTSAATVVVIRIERRAVILNILIHILNGLVHILNSVVHILQGRARGGDGGGEQLISVGGGLEVFILRVDDADEESRLDGGRERRLRRESTVDGGTFVFARYRSSRVARILSFTMLLLVLLTLAED